jgi:hypothetical protein
MITLLKLARLALTALCALLLFISIRGDDIVGLVIVAVPTALVLVAIWGLPMLFRHSAPSLPVKFRDGFNPDIAHDNIALDSANQILWIRDPVRGERYLHRADVLTIKTDSDWNNGTFRQRLEFQISDVHQPTWQVLFQRHSDRWIKSSKINGAERDEWFARMRAWLNAALSKPSSAPSTADKEYTLSELYQAYLWAGTDEEARQNWLVAFDIQCFSEGLDARKEWERLDGIYPGPSPDLLRMQGV